MQTEIKPASNKTVAGALAVWLVVASVVGASGVQGKLPMPVPQIILAALTAVLLLVTWRVAPIREWAMSVDVKTLVKFHLTRFVGFYFLYLHSRGELPYAFAVPGGVGDIAVAMVALVVLAAPANSAATLRIYSLWNLLGLADILFVVFTAARLGLANPASMKALTHLPLSLLITFVVPIIIATHVLIFVRLRKMKRAAAVT